MVTSGHSLVAVFADPKAAARFVEMMEGNPMINEDLDDAEQYTEQYPHPNVRTDTR